MNRRGYMSYAGIVGADFGVGPKVVAGGVGGVVVGVVVGVADAGGVADIVAGVVDDGGVVAAGGVGSIGLDAAVDTELGEGGLDDVDDDDGGIAVSSLWTAQGCTYLGYHLDQSKVEMSVLCLYHQVARFFYLNNVSPQDRKSS